MSPFRNIIATIVGLFFGRGLFIPKGINKNPLPRSVWVLSPGTIPTTDIYFRGKLERQFKAAVRHVDTLKTTPGVITPDHNCMIVIVRHAPMPWMRWLEKNRSRFSGVIFFMDDDIPAAATAAELPFRYAVKTAWRYARSRRLLGRVCSEVWVSTEELARRYAYSSPKLIEPEFVAANPSEEKPVVYFYHGSWAHRQEMAWLVPIVRKVQKQVPGAWFEIMGTDRVKRMFRGIPRVRVVHPMPWSDYLAYAGNVRYQVGLAPCFDSHFNQARSHSKIFDITRLGAAGIYSNVTPFAEKIIHGETGLLCDNVQDQWVAAIVRLLNNRTLRTSLYDAAIHWCTSGQP